MFCRGHSKGGMGGAALGQGEVLDVSYKVLKMLLSPILEPEPTARHRGWSVWTCAHFKPTTWVANLRSQWSQQPSSDPKGHAAP